LTDAIEITFRSFSGAAAIGQQGAPVKKGRCPYYPMMAIKKIGNSLDYCLKLGSFHSRGILIGTLIQ